MAEQLRDVEKYVDEWTRTMIAIWREKIERLRVVDTGKLHQSFKDQIQHTAEGSTIRMKFLQYGLYQARGVGNGYKRGNGGNLEILDPEYRREHGLKKKRKPRDWFSKKLYMSTMAMIEDVARITGEEAARVICEGLAD